MPLYLAATFVLEEGFPLADLQADRANRWRRRRAPPACRSSPATPRSSSRARATACSSRRPAWASFPTASTSAATARDRATRSSSAARWATTASRSCRCARICRSRRRSNRTPRRCTTSSRRWSAAVPGIHCLRDPTRGGLATTLNEIATQSGCGMVIRERDLPIKPQVERGMRVPRPRSALCRQRGKAGRDLRRRRTPQRLLAAMRAHPLGRDAAIIGEVVADPQHFVQMETTLRRPPQRRLADRRAAAANLLAPPPCASCSSRIRSTASRSGCTSSSSTRATRWRSSSTSTSG